MINIFDNYYNTKLELENLKKRSNLISVYEKQFKEEKKQINEIIKFQEKFLNQIENDLKSLTGIKSQIYSEIVINGTKVTKSIDKVAHEVGKDPSTLWKNYYPDVKKRIMALNSLSNYENEENDLK